MRQSAKSSVKVYVNEKLIAMGQINCRLSPCDNILRSQFANLRKESVDALWTSYNVLGETWGLTVNNVVTLFRLMNTVESIDNENDPSIEERVEYFFLVLDSDKNGRIDALEMFAIISMLSAMDTVEKILFLFNLYDFDSTDSLSIDDITLMMVTAVRGLKKIFPESGAFCVKESTIEFYAA